MARGNGHRKRIALQTLSNPPEGRAVLNFQGGPYVRAGRARGGLCVRDMRQGRRVRRG
jgi:hypothetical protein